MKLPYSILAALFITNPSFAADSIRVATFNVSMDATNYANNPQEIKADSLSTALKEDHQQIRNIAEIIQRVRPDIILLNEFDYIEQSSGIDYFKHHYLQVSQQKQPTINYP
ncbi:MAG: endonuclease/exonuclease/phosphatase family protein, partial [Pseudoalteromonas sp.]